MTVGQAVDLPTREWAAAFEDARRLVAAALDEDTAAAAAIYARSQDTGRTNVLAAALAGVTIGLAQTAGVSDDDLRAWLADPDVAAGAYGAAGSRTRGRLAAKSRRRRRRG